MDGRIDRWMDGRTKPLKEMGGRILSTPPSAPTHCPNDSEFLATELMIL